MALLTFLCRCGRPPFSVNFLNLNFGGNGDFLDFLFQDTFNAVLLRYLSDVVGASCWFKKVGKKVATTVDLVLSVTKTDTTFYLLFLIYCTFDFN
jgi:hypothetical protein